MQQEVSHTDSCANFAKCLKSKPSKIYQTINCPFCQRVKFAMELLGVSYNQVELDLLSHQLSEEWYRKINPNETVPSVVFPDGSILCDSYPIVKKLDEAHGSVLTNRNGENFQAAFDIAQNQLNKSFFAYFNAWRVAENKESNEVLSLEAAFKGVLLALAKEYKHSKSYFFGSQTNPSLFDALFLSFLFQINNAYRLVLKKELFYSTVPQEQEVLTRFKSYFEFAVQTPQFQRITSKYPALPEEGQNLYMKEKHITKIEQYNYDQLFTFIFAKKFDLKL